MMQRTVAHANAKVASSAALGGAVRGHLNIPWRELAPLIRVALVLLSFFVLVSSYLFIKVHVVQLHKEVDTIGRMIAQAEVTNTQLRLELDARGRTRALEAVAVGLSLRPVASNGVSRSGDGGLAAGGGPR